MRFMYFSAVSGLGSSELPGLKIILEIIDKVSELGVCSTSGLASVLYHAEAKALVLWYCY